MGIDPGAGAPTGGGAVPAGGEARTSERLQSMLAQAVEGQQHEQRELVSALTDMRNQVLRLGQEIAALRAAPGEGGADPAAVNAVTVELREAVRFLSERLDGVTRMIAQRGEELADVRAALAAVDAHVRSQTETIGVLSQGLQALPSYGERVSALHDAIGAVHNRLAAVETSVTRAGDTTGLEARLADLEAAVRPLGEQVAQSRNAATEHAASLAEATRALQQHGASLESLHDRVAAIADGTQAALAVPPVFDESTIAGLEAKLSAISDELAAVRDRGGSAPAADAIAAAVREAELRLRAHVDDAVLALAEMLVRRRPASTAGSGAPASWPEPAPSYEAPEPASAPAPTVAVAPAASVSPPEAASLLDDEAEHATPIVDFSVAEFADEDGDSDLAASSSAAADLDEDEDEDADDGGYDEPPAEAEYDDATDVDDDDEDSDDYEDDDYDDDAEDDAADGAAADSAEDGEDLDATSEIKFPRPAVMPPEGTAEASSIPAPPASWSPEVPPERGEPESGGDTIVPEGRKRRWFSR